jgi:RNA polymerase sigma factor (sigma-70 family)
VESIIPAKAEDRPEYSEDRELARRCASGDERALREVFEAHEPRLRKLLYRNLGCREDAEELAGTTFVRFWKSAHRFRGSCSLKAYLTRIALNLCRDAGRKRRTLEPQEPALMGEEHPWAEPIREGLLRLERDDRELLSLYYLEDWDYNEICDSLGIGYDVLRTRLVRARKKLRAIVEEGLERREV